jgi:CRP-like cAMP-binding protein
MGLNKPTEGISWIASPSQALFGASVRPMPWSLSHRRGDGGSHVARPNPQGPQGENRLLKRLDAHDLARLQPTLKKVALVHGHVLYPAGAPIEHVYFPVSGMVSILAVMRTGEQIETAIIGREGVVGASIGTDSGRSAGQATVQIAGSALQIRSADFLALYKASETFRTLVNKFQALILVQAQQSAACHAVHTVEERLCRWLLQSQDTTETDEVPLTQEFLSHMLGVQRTSVTLAAQTLQKAGLIQYSRGVITILDRAGLKESACECYDVIREHIENAGRLDNNLGRATFQPATPRRKRGTPVRRSRLPRAPRPT